MEINSILLIFHFRYINNNCWTYLIESVTKIGIRLVHIVWTFPKNTFTKCLICLYSHSE